MNLMYYAITWKNKVKYYLIHKIYNIYIYILIYTHVSIFFYPSKIFVISGITLSGIAPRKRPSVCLEVKH